MGLKEHAQESEGLFPRSSQSVPLEAESNSEELAMLLRPTQELLADSYVV